MQKSKKFIIEDNQGNNMYPATFADVVFTEDGGNVAEKLKQIEGATPNAHTHTKSQITDFAHAHTKSEISDFPTSLPANGGNADTVGGKRAEYFAPKVNTTLEGTTTIRGKLINEHDTRIMSIPFANWCPNSTFRYDMKGWNYKQGSGTWGVSIYPQIGNAVSCSASSGLSYIDHRGTTFYGSPGIELFISFWAYTSENTTGNAKVELISSKTNNLVADSLIPNKKGWTFYRFSYTPSELGDYYIRLVAKDTNERVYFSKIKVEHYGYSQWCERDLDVIAFGGGDSVIKSIQRGAIQVNAGEDEKTITISQINASKSFVILNGDYASSSSSRAPYVKVLNNGNFVIANSYEMSSSPSVVVSWQVIEFK